MQNRNTKQILEWYYQNKRDLPWRKTKDPYKIWLSEIILQQTRIEQGMPYYFNFIEKYPDIFCLANAEEDQVLKLWQGLGYYSRARNMHETAKKIISEFHGVFPNDFKSILALKGVGEYTASLIASVCFNQPYAVLDGNVYRLLSRIYGSYEIIGSNNGKKYIKDKADQLLDENNPGDFNQAMMDLGSTICTPKNPSCDICPINSNCLAFRDMIQHLLPVKSKKSALKTRFLNYLLISDNHGLLLKQRNESDIWKSLFELPLVEKTSNEILHHAEIEWLDEKLIKEIHQISRMNHLLTHRKLEIVFYKLELNIDIQSLLTNGVIYVRNEELKKYAVPKPIERFLSSYLMPFEK